MNYEAMVRTGLLQSYETHFSMSKARTASTLKWFVRTPSAGPMTPLLERRLEFPEARIPRRVVGFAR